MFIVVAGRIICENDGLEGYNCDVGNFGPRFLLINSSPQFGQDKAALEQSIPLQLGPEIYK